MKVLKDNYNTIEMTSDTTKQIEPYPRKIICESCRSELEYEESDLRMGIYGCMFVDCPLCGRDNMLEENEHSITLTVDNIVYPTHFYHTSKETGAVDCCNNEEVRKCIRQGIDWLRKNKEQFSWFVAYGNLYVRIDRYDGGESYEVIVTNNYYEMYIPFESEDY